MWAYKYFVHLGHGVLYLVCKKQNRTTKTQRSDLAVESGKAEAGCMEKFCAESGTCPLGL